MPGTHVPEVGHIDRIVGRADVVFVVTALTGFLRGVDDVLSRGIVLYRPCCVRHVGSDVWAAVFVRISIIL